MRTKKELAVTLSRLQNFDRPSIFLEQYPTDSEIAAEIIWNMYLCGEIENKVIADLGCGTGILGIGCMFFGPKKVYFVDKDRYALKKLRENLELQGFDADYEIIESDINEFKEQVDIVIQNPPFGTKNEHADKAFLEKAFKITDHIYSFHKTNTRRFIEAITKDNQFKIDQEFKYSFPIKRAHDFHKRDIHRIEVSCFKLSKQ